MKRDLKQQIKNLDNKELIGRIKTTQIEIQDLVLDKNMNKLADRKAVFKKRKELTLLQTVLQQKQLIGELEASKDKEQARGDSESAGPRAKKVKRSENVKAIKK